MPEGAGGPLWRVFPWDPRAEDGAPFSARFVPPGQGSGRFDLPSTPVLYLAGSPEHAVGEKIQRFRGQELEDDDLREYGRRLALVSVHLTPGAEERVAELCDPAVLLELGLRPDQLAARNLETSRAAAARVHAAGHAGLSWWSSLWGEWHTTVLFLDRVPPDALRLGRPEPLALTHPALREAAAALAIRLSGRR